MRAKSGFRPVAKQPNKKHAAAVAAICIIVHPMGARLAASNPPYVKLRM
jgi:hypothetical protein